MGEAVGPVAKFIWDTFAALRPEFIEDDPAVAESIELMLTSEGIKVQKTELGQDGLDLGSVMASSTR